PTTLPRGGDVCGKAVGAHATNQGTIVTQPVLQHGQGRPRPVTVGVVLLCGTLHGLVRGYVDQGRADPAQNVLTRGAQLPSSFLRCFHHRRNDSAGTSGMSRVSVHAPAGPGRCRGTRLRPAPAARGTAPRAFQEEKAASAPAMIA